MIESMKGILWAADILSGRREFPTYNKTEKKEDGFREVFEKELSRIEEDQDAKHRQAN